MSFFFLFFEEKESGINNQKVKVVYHVKLIDNNIR